MDPTLDTNSPGYEFESLDSPLVMITGVTLPPEPPTANTLLARMRMRVEVLGSPLPDGFVPPPGIDLDALLKQVPWPPPEAGPSGR